MWQEPRTWIARFSPAFAVALVACSMARGQDVRTNYLPGTDFSKYRTYSWADIPGGGRPDEIVETEIKQSIDSQLVAKGLTKVDSGTSDSPNAADYPQPPGLPEPSNFPHAADLPHMADSPQMADSAHKADLLVDYQILINQERRWNATGMRNGLGWPGGMDTAMGTATSSTIYNGILVFNIYDAATKKLVWTGFAVKEINLSKDQQKNRRNLDKATQKLLKDFPPRGR